MLRRHGFSFFSTHQKQDPVLYTYISLYSEIEVNVPSKQIYICCRYDSRNMEELEIRMKCFTSLFCDPEVVLYPLPSLFFLTWMLLIGNDRPDYKLIISLVIETKPVNKDLYTQSSARIMS